MTLFRLKNVQSFKHSNIKLFHLPTLIHNSLFINNMYVTLLSSHVLSINMPIVRRKNCITQHLLSSLSVNGCTVHRLRADCSQPVYYAALYRER